jgi:uncharacterized protein YlxW (UPF0749 family)
MTLIGKIFIVMILIASIVFMSFAICVYATHQNWKELVTSTNPAKPGLRQQLRSAQDTNTDLESQLERLKNVLSMERAARTEAIAVLEQRNQELDRTHAETNAKYEQLFAQHSTAIATVQQAQNQLEQLKQQVTALRQSILEAQRDRDEQFAKTRDLTDLLHQSEGTKVILEQRLKKLTDQYARAQEVLKSRGETIDTPVANIAPQVEGKVVEAGEDMITISLGSDDGIRPGHLVDVSRRDQYLARARITRVTADRAVAQLLGNEFRKATVQEGDNVQTKVQ